MTRRRLLLVVLLAIGAVRTIAQAPAVYYSLGVQKVLVLPVAMGSADGWSPSVLTTGIFDWANQRVRLDSYGQASFDGIVAPLDRLPNIYTDCDLFRTLRPMAALAVNAAQAAGIDVNAYRRHVIQYSGQLGTCAFGGISEFGYPTSSVTSREWLNNRFDPATITHEFGHTIGFNHDSGKICRDAAGNFITFALTGCTIAIYGDPVGQMSNTMGGTFGPAARETAHWMGEGTPVALTDIHQSGVYSFQPIELQPGPFPSALKVMRAYDTIGQPNYYYLHTRQPIGADAPLSSTEPWNEIRNFAWTHGIIIQNSAPGASVYLLDMTPDGSFENAPLQPGQVYTDPGKLTIKTISVTPAQAVAEVTILSPPLSCSVSPAIVPVGQPATVTGLGGDGTYCWSDVRTATLPGAPSITGWTKCATTYPVSFPAAGTYTIRVGSGPQLSSCVLSVGTAAPPPTPRAFGPTRVL